MGELSKTANQVAENVYLKLIGRVGMTAVFLILLPLILYIARDVYESNRVVIHTVIELKTRFEEHQKSVRDNQSSLIEVFNSRLNAQADRITLMNGQMNDRFSEMQKTNETQNAAIEELRRRVYQIPIPLRVQTP